MIKVINVEMERPKDCNHCRFLSAFDYDEYYCILSGEEPDEIVDVVNEKCPFLRENNTIVKIAFLQD